MIFKDSAKIKKEKEKDNCSKATIQNHPRGYWTGFEKFRR
jgi:hypothetical protein